jgi:TPR repeat protein
MKKRRLPLLPLGALLFMMPLAIQAENSAPENNQTANQESTKSNPQNVPNQSTSQALTTAQRLEQRRIQMQAEQDKIKKQLQLAQQQNNQPVIVLLSTINQLLTAELSCFDGKDDKGTRNCINKAIRDQAEGGNFIAQLRLANMYNEFVGDQEMAMKWYQKALDNPNAPASYKERIKQDMESAKNIGK